MIWDILITISFILLCGTNIYRSYLDKKNIDLQRVIDKLDLDLIKEDLVKWVKELEPNDNIPEFKDILEATKKLIDEIDNIDFKYYTSHFTADDIKNKYRKLNIKYKGELYNYAAKKFKEHGIDSKFVKFIEGE